MKEAERVIPHLFRCPISLDLFSDPVTLCTGQTYDRSSIEKWLAAGKLTCPVTMQRLHDLSLVPNHTLRHLIDEWLQMGTHHFDSNSNYFETINMDCLLAALKQNLESPESTFETKLQTLKRIQVLSDESSSENPCLIQLGFLVVLLELLFGGKHSADNVKFAEEALSCVLKLLPFGELGCLNVLKEDSKLASFLALFELGNSMIKTSLCRLVEVISSSLEMNELCAILGQNPKLLNGIILLLHQNSEATEAGAKALLALCSMESNRASLVREGGVDGLITYISSAVRRERSAAPIAMATLELLLGLESGKEALCNNPNGVNAIVKMVFRVSDHEGSESAINSLTIICYNSLRAQEEAICDGVLTQLLLLLQSQCHERIKTKARMLLKLLRSMWAEKPKHL